MTSYDGPIADYHDREAWLNARQQSIGGSEIAALFGEHPFLTKRELYDRKIMGEPAKDSIPMRRGRLFEPIAVQIYEEETGRKTRRVPLRWLKGDSHISASADRQILAGEDHGTMPLEVKVPGWQTMAKVRRDGLLPYMILQGQQEALVHNKEQMAYAIFHADSLKLLAFDVALDVHVADRIFEEATRFWFDHVVPGVPPVEEAPRIELPEVSGEIVKVEDPELLRALEDLLEARTIAKEAAALQKHAKAQVRDRLPGAGVFEGEGMRVYLRQDQGRKTFDKRALEHARPLDSVAVAMALLELEETGAIDAAQRRAVEAAVTGKVLDLAQFQKRGNPFEVLSPYDMRGEEL